MVLTGFSADSIAAHLSEHGLHATPQLVSQWRTGKVHLPFAVVPFLMAMGRPEDWTGALVRTVDVLAGDEHTEDSLTLARRGLRTLRETSELVTHLAEALDDGRIDQLEARRLIDEAREARAALERLSEALLPVAEGRSSAR